MNRTRFLFWLDCVLLLMVAVLQSPRVSSLAVHEWLALVFSAIVALHLLVNWRWIVNTLRKVAAPESKRARISASLNGLLFVTMTIAVFSGLAISEIVLPGAGFTTSPLIAWRKIHSFFASTSLGIVGLHVALNWDWVSGVIKKRILFRSPPGVTAPVSPDA